VRLGVAAVYYRWVSLPPSMTFVRYWNFSLPSAKVHPTHISKVRQGVCDRTNFFFISLSLSTLFHLPSLSLYLFPFRYFLFFFWLLSISQPSPFPL
jgi:hypothetical protein